MKSQSNPDWKGPEDLAEPGSAEISSQGHYPVNHYPVRWMEPLWVAHSAA